ncbi:MAG: Broad-specificity amino acid ABC transporter, permease protein 1 [uncultured Paraburkholderia sp.]|uniref:branched-chain amino acid ABC transporter permease n=1 Tax=uncultured Paraburkholderia sp. TaxID=1822466 RepID=UPI0025919E0A|nr:branched-chain amino acid ABC transporter permease [uncultured Paraburkholderia sp.]CAH2904009.1 MAG: Broad-specificity amino acid ABC transporter, permease protein 1 [uncultured Paraburkholderia sp.]CAH2942180.1 MAG: Broad-specificity amino acid ABC transporter, permease protein 1 [uncultured Paraburkholderia sp.]
MNLSALVGQLLVGLINGSFYAMLSLGVAVVFGLLHVVNFAHGTLYMLGAFLAWLALQQLGLSYWSALIVIPLVVAAIGALIERSMLSRLKGLDPIYGFLLTFGISLSVEGLFTYWFGSSGRPYPPPELLRGGMDLGVAFLPVYRVWIVVASLFVCMSTWFFIERTRLGATMRSATENAPLVQVFGVNVPLLVTLTYAGSAGLAALAGVLAAPVFQVSAHMGSQLLILVFAVVVIGGMGSILGAVVTGYALGIIEGITKVVYPEGASIVIFVVMAVVLLLKPGGLFARSR